MSSRTATPAWDEGIARLLAKLPDALAAGALTINDTRVIHHLEQQVTELRELAEDHYRRAERLVREYRGLTAEVIAGLTTAEHEMTMKAGLPFCHCGKSLDGGHASGAFITHALAAKEHQ